MNRFKSMPRQRLILLGGVVLILLILALLDTLIGAQQNGTLNDFPTLTLTEPQPTEQIAWQLFNAYLEHYRSPTVGARKALSDYSLEQLAVLEETQTGFQFAVSFSVHPVSGFSDWIAGNGVARQDGWIENKYLFVQVSANGNSYRITSIGTGP